MTNIEAGTNGRSRQALLRYGSDPSQVVYSAEPAGAPMGGARGVAVLIHGGYWRAKHDASLMQPLADSLRSDGWAVANVEYRRVGNGGGWPATPDDAAAAVDAVATSPWRGRHPGPLIAVGHSVGGQLALLSGPRVDAVVALAPVTDLVRTDEEGLGEDAALEFFGAHAAQAPQAYAAASPIRRLPVGCPVLIVHGTADVRVPLDHSRAFCRAASEAGDAIELREVDGVDHLDVIDPASTAWAEAAAWMASFASARSSARSPAANSSAG